MIWRYALAHRTRQHSSNESPELCHADCINSIADAQLPKDAFEVLIDSARRALQSMSDNTGRVAGREEREDSKLLRGQPGIDI